MLGRLGILGASAALTIAAAAPAGAATASALPHTVAPTAVQRAAIIEAFGDPSAASSCLIVRLAASGRHYGTVRFRTRPSCNEWAFNGVNVIERVGNRHWKVAFEGSAYRCPVPRIPRRVQRDLDVCP